MVDKSDNLIQFSVIIPARNEAANIESILKNLECQDYPKELFEVIVIDDFSEDGTVQVVQQLIASINLNLRLEQLSDPTKQGKKHALTVGVKAAKYDTILTTDADCWFGENWIRSYSYSLINNVNMVAGPVAIEGRGIFARLQQVEFAGLIGFGAVTISEENPSMCSGANLGFKKTAFEEVGGYTNNLFTPSGDDEFLLFNIMRNFPHSTVFLKSEEAVVHTSAHSKLRSFMNQRTRWTSKWKHNKNWKVRMSAILFFSDYLIFYGAIAAAILGMLDATFIMGIAIMRFMALLFFVSPVNRFMRGKSSFFPLLLFQIIYPLHVLFMGMNSIFGSYTWKGRKYG